MSEASPADLRECVRRVYRDAVTVEGGRGGGYVTGDFNGDGSRDIAVVVRPGGGMLEEINNELANWILQDPRAARPSSIRKAAMKPGERPPGASVARGDLLLAVIHGHKAEGWRDPLATQSYLLKNAAGTELKTRTRAEARGARWAEGSPPGLRGDVICGTLARERGFLYWDGAKYVWHH